MADEDPWDDWRLDAACKGMDTRLWFSFNPSDQVKARSVCNGCIVRQPCREASRGEYGMWAGAMSPRRGADPHPGERARYDTGARPAWVREQAVANLRQRLEGQPVPVPLAVRQVSEIEPASRRDAVALSPSDRAVLADDTTDALVRAYVDRYGDDLAKRTETFRKVADAARAEAEALLAIHAVADARRRVAELTTGTERP